MQQLVQDLKDWARKPYNENGSLIDWFLFIGVLTACTILWTRVIRRLVD
jgi:hypothetical protein